MAEVVEAQSPVHLPRVVIKFCVQCKWNLRAAYYAQELLQTFSNTLGEIALVPVTGGTFTITLHHLSETQGTPTTTQIWDRKLDGGFPETKELKNRVRNLVDPARDMGHIDRSLKKGGVGEQGQGQGPEGGREHVHGGTAAGEDCEECRRAAAEVEGTGGGK